MKKANSMLLVVLLIFVLLPVVVKVNTAKANFLQIPLEWECPPIITISSPLNQTYSISNIDLSFNVTQPATWLQRQRNLLGGFGGDGSSYQTSLVMVSYTIDDNMFNILDNSRVFEGYDSIKPSLVFSSILSDLSEGLHVLQINASGRGYFIGKDYYNSEDKITYNLGGILTSYAAVIFTIDSISSNSIRTPSIQLLFPNISQITPSTLSPSPSPSPTPTQQPTPTFTISPTPSPTFTPSLSPTITQQPTAEPTQSVTPPPHDDSFLNYDVTTPIIIGLLALAVLVGLAFILRKHFKETKVSG